MNRGTSISVWCILIVAILATGCTDPASKLPRYGTVPAFTMTDSAGHPFDGKALAGKIWVADFIYTNCPAECPMMTARMHKVEKQVRGQEDVRLVSFSVDPQRDTPQALNEFAHRFGGPTDHWYFLTGTPETVHLLAYETFHVGDVIGKIEHSTKMVLVDKHGEIRGFYSTFDEEGVPALLRDIAALRRDRTS